ncbi:protein COBRA [Trifolium repens]|nr:protein COBRA [Trifolium repens]
MLHNYNQNKIPYINVQNSKSQEYQTHYSTMMRLCFSFLCVLGLSSYAVAYGPLDQKDPNGNITIKWDVISWTEDGYVATVKINNFQKFRQIKNPG